MPVESVEVSSAEVSVSEIATVASSSARSFVPVIVIVTSRVAVTEPSSAVMV